MTSFDVAITAGALCGLAMVGGSIYLLRVGAIDLKALTNQAEQAALAIKIKEIRLTTRYPAIALFVIGLGFVLGSALLAKPDPKVVQMPLSMSVKPFADGTFPHEIKAQIYSAEEDVPISPGQETTYVYDHKLQPSNLYARVALPGSDSTTRLFQREEHGTWRLELDPATLSNGRATLPPETDRHIKDEENL